MHVVKCQIHDLHFAKEKRKHSIIGYDNYCDIVTCLGAGSAEISKCIEKLKIIFF